MLSKNKQKYLHRFSYKKFRDEQQVFLAEGTKIIKDLLPYFHCDLLCVTDGCAAAFSPTDADEYVVVADQELEKVSLLCTSQGALAVFRQRKPQLAEAVSNLPVASLCLALDGVQDPGNLGTILRAADWWGIEHVFCSEQCADAYAPKTVQATMGAIGRVHVHRVDLAEWLSSLPAEVAVYGTFLDGENIHTASLSPTGVLVMGHEGRGISDAVARLVNRRLFIPSFPPERLTSESLNVAIATAVCCAEFRRRYWANLNS